MSFSSFMHAVDTISADEGHVPCKILAARTFPVVDKPPSILVLKVWFLRKDSIILTVSIEVMRAVYLQRKIS